MAAQFTYWECITPLPLSRDRAKLQSVVKKRQIYTYRCYSNTHPVIFSNHVPSLAGSEVTADSQVNTGVIHNAS